jgi:hypothetical protein
MEEQITPTPTIVLIITKYSHLTILNRFKWMEECYILSSTRLVLIPKMRLLKKRSCDNSPYGQMIPEVKKNVHKTSLSLDDYRFNGSFRRKMRSSRTSIRNFMYRTTLFLSKETLTQLKLKNGSKKYFGAIKEYYWKRNIRRGTNTETIKSKIWGYKHSNPNGCSCLQNSLRWKLVMLEFWFYFYNLSDGKSSLYKKNSWRQKNGLTNWCV